MFGLEPVLRELIPSLFYPAQLFLGLPGIVIKLPYLPPHKVINAREPRVDVASGELELPHISLLCPTETMNFNQKTLHACVDLYFTGTDNHNMHRERESEFNIFWVNLYHVGRCYPLIN